MFVRMTEIEFWKVVDLFKRNQQEVRFLSDDQFKVYYCASEALYYVLAATYGLFPFNGMTTIQFQFAWSLVHKMKYYRLTGELDTTSYDHYEPDIEQVDQFVLAPSKDEVLKLAGYWPEHDGSKVWHWVGGPNIEPARDYEVVSERVMALLGNFSVKSRLGEIQLDHVQGEIGKIELIKNDQVIEMFELSSFAFTIKLSIDKLIETNSDDILEMEFYNV